MVPPTHPFAKIVADDPRYAVGAYFFVFDALQFAHEQLEMGRRAAGEDAEETERHVTGQELCEAIRQYTLHEFGFMAKRVLNSWGLTCTGDFGEIVYNLIRHGRMKKTAQDRREDFDNVFDFERDLSSAFKITLEKIEL